MVANRTQPQADARRLGHWLRGEVGRELRIARYRAGLRQRDVAAAIGASTSHVSRVENAQLANLGLESLARHAASVGLRPSVRLYPLGRRLLDRPQLELLARFRSRLHPSWRWETEVPMPIDGDLRSGDCRISHPGCAILVEAYTRLADWQAQTASAARKKRDLRADRLVILVAATHANRRALAEAEAISSGSFPMRTKAALSALATGSDPGADCLVVL